jgi:hypothetical protein
MVLSPCRIMIYRQLKKKLGEHHITPGENPENTTTRPKKIGRIERTPRQTITLFDWTEVSADLSRVVLQPNL